MVPPCPLVTVKVSEEIFPTSINSPATLIMSPTFCVAPKSELLDTTTLVAEFVNAPFNVDVPSLVSTPLHTPAPQPVLGASENAQQSSARLNYKPSTQHTVVPYESGLTLILRPPQQADVNTAL